MSRTHRIDIRVYYEDTDLAGIVYYANYLKFIERGRTELLRSAGIDQMALKRQTGLVFAVRKVTAEFHKPAFMDDLLAVDTTITTISGARIIMKQDVRKAESVLFGAEVTLAALGPEGKPLRLPKKIRALAP